MHKVIIMGDFNKSYPPHFNAEKALLHSAKSAGIEITVEWISTNTLDTEGTALLKKADSIWAGPAPYENETGIFSGIRYARENNIPFLGTCGGMYYSVMEFARNQLNLPAEITKIGMDAQNKEQLFHQSICCKKGEFYPIEINITENSLAAKMYAQLFTEETSNCGFAVNKEYLSLFQENGLACSGSDNMGDTKIFELVNNDFFVLTKFLPQMQSTEKAPHPIINAFIKAGALVG